MTYPDYKKLLVAIDFSEVSEQCLIYGISLAEKTKASIILVNVINYREIAAIQQYVGLQETGILQSFLEDTYKNRKEDLDKMLKIATEKGIKGKAAVMQGVPYQIILETITLEKPDLLILGTKGRSNLVDTIIGSCAQKLYRRSPIPILSIPPSNN